MASSSPYPDDIAVRLVEIRYGASGINVYRFQSVDGAALPAFEPGAHIDLEISPTHRRQYSLLWPAVAANSYSVAVQVAEIGRGGSKSLHYDSVVGQVYRVSAPRNHFALQPDAKKYVLFAGGIGITPIVSMYRWLRHAGYDAELHYWAATPARTLFIDELSQDGTVHLHHEVTPGVPPVQLTEIVSALSDDTQLYCCGPERMLEAFDTISANRPIGTAHRERFGAVAALPPEDVKSFQVKLVRSDRTLSVNSSESLLQACLNAGIDVAYSCEEGVCGACEVSVLDGEIDHRDSVLTPAERAGNRKMMICCSRAARGGLTLDL